MQVAAASYESSLASNKHHSTVYALNHVHDHSDIAAEVGLLTKQSLLVRLLTDSQSLYAYD